MKISNGTYKNSKIKYASEAQRGDENKVLIDSIKAREILDSRGNPTVEVEVNTEKGSFLASVPSGVSKGKYEAVELRDGGRRYLGMGVLKAVRNINEVISPKLKGKDVTQQKKIDGLMIKLDGTKNKSKLGANAIIGVSMGCCRAGAAAKNLSLYQYIAQLAENISFLNLPIPSFNIINGGVHAGNELDIQEFMIVPQAKSFKKSLQIASEVYHQLKKIIKKRYTDLGANVGDEGGFAPPVQVPEQAIDLILGAVKSLGYQKKIKIILDCAASQFFTAQKYRMKIGVFTKEGLLRYYLRLIEKYPILGVEDPFAQDDWRGFQEITKKFKKKIVIIGDDLLVTNSQRIKEAYQKKACNGLLLKLNQIGTATEAIEAAKLAKSYGWKIMVSHRSGETDDDFISDLAVGIGADYIKAGAPARGERVAKYNRLLRIEEELKK